MIILDTETTGLLKPWATNPANQPYITEFYAIKIDENWEMVDELETFLKPPIPLPEETIKITGITEEMVAFAPSFIQFYDDLCDFFLGETVMVAHNEPFDAGMIRAELQRHDLQFSFPWPKNHHCTVELSYPIKNRRLRLTQLHEIATGRPHDDGAHRAKSDVMALVRCYKWLHENGFVR